ETSESDAAGTRVVLRLSDRHRMGRQSRRHGGVRLYLTSSSPKSSVISSSTTIPRLPLPRRLCFGLVGATLSQREHQSERKQQRDRDFYKLPNVVNSEDWSNSANHRKSNGLSNG